MSIVISPGYTWLSGATVMPSRLNLTPTISLAANNLLGSVAGGLMEEIPATAAGRALIAAADLAAQKTLLNILAVGNTAGTVCAGDDARLSDARQCNNTFANAGTSRTALGLGSAALAASTDFDAAGAAGAAQTAAIAASCQRASNLSDLANVATARGNLGLDVGNTPTFASLNLVNTDTGATQAVLAVNGGSGSGGGPYLSFQRNSIAKWVVGSESAILGNTSDALMMYSPTYDIKLLPGGGSTPTTVANSGITSPSFNVSSARRLKKNIRALRGALDLALELRPVSYDAKQGPQHLVGFIAEEINELLPALVSKDSNGRVTGLDYGKLTAVLAGAVKELNKRLLRLEAHA